MQHNKRHKCATPWYLQCFAINLPNDPPIGAIAISPDGGTLYATEKDANNISDIAVVNTATNAVTANIPSNATPSGVSVSADGTRLYVVDQSGQKLLVLNTATNAIIATVPVGSGATSFGNFLVNATGCTSAPVTFTITVNTASPNISSTGTMPALNTTYGTASPSSGIKVQAAT